ncbi:hypothetical protein SAMN06265795_102578 [Noviherbaspirillum humi]|uniref:Uncharacterized protein n=1 Tax=Noviherbaspirillum humi TaxID=1688639 RepID=A0A239E864_9BURK|nr:hypothetical protein SAMN06265795_102578 [Noviherbaspirillum humi]
MGRTLHNKIKLKKHSSFVEFMLAALRLFRLSSQRH